MRMEIMKGRVCPVPSEGEELKRVEERVARQVSAVEAAVLKDIRRVLRSHRLSARGPETEQIWNGVREHIWGTLWHPAVETELLGGRF